MSKLRSTHFSIENACRFANIHLMTQVCFESGVIAFNEKQEEILKNITESTLLRKLGLREKFLRRMSHAKKTQLGLEIMQPQTILSVLSLKLCLGHK